MGSREDSIAERRTLLQEVRAIEGIDTSGLPAGLRVYFEQVRRSRYYAIRVIEKYHKLKKAPTKARSKRR